MKDLRDLKDLTIHDVQPISDEYSTGLAGVRAGALFERQLSLRKIRLAVHAFKSKFCSGCPALIHSMVTSVLRRQRYRGTLLIRKPPPPQDHRRALGIVLL